MRQLTILFIIILAFYGRLSAQCPTAGFNLPDSGCAGTAVLIGNTSLGGTGTLNFSWDLASGDLRNAVTGNNAGTYPGIVSSSLGVDLIYDGTDYYGFVANNYGALIRLDFGNNFNNTPVMNNLGNIGGLMGGMFDINIIQSGTDWFGYFHTGGGTLVKLSFGASLSNLPTADNVSLAGASFSTPYYSKLVFDGINYIYLAANQSGNSISVVNLGSNLSSTTATVVNIPVMAAGPLSVTVARDCNQWYGFVGYSGTTDLSRIDFGTSLLNASPAITSISPSPTVGTTREMDVIHENSKWYIALNTLDGNNFSILDFGNSLTQLPTATTYGTFGVIAAGDYCHTLKHINSEVIGLSVNYGSGAVSRIKFPSLSAMPSYSTATDPLVTFTHAGWNPVTLEVTDNTGANSSFTDSIFIQPAPVAGFTYTPICEATLFQLTDTSTVSSGTIQSWLWNFGDNTTSLLQNPQHQFAVTDTFLIALEVTSSAGCTSSDTVSVIVSPLPVAAFSFSAQACENSTVQFTDNSTVSAGSVTGWLWNFGNGDSSNFQNPPEQFTVTGNYPITFTAISDAGCRDTITSSIDILPAPAAAYYVTNTCIGDSVHFINQTTFTGTGNISYSWNFGDGDSSSSFNPFHNYTATAANWQTSLIATAANGCTDSITQLITVNEKALPGFTVTGDTVCANNSVVFTDTSIAPLNSSINNWFWTFGDGDTASGNGIVTHYFQNPGSYTVTLTVSTPTSCDTTISKPIFVIESPTAAFTTIAVCFGDSIHFTDLSVPPAGSSIQQWTWLFGDTDSSMMQEPVHLYANPGTYAATLQVVSSKGCTGTYQDSVNVYEVPVASFSFSLPCSGQQINFTDGSQVINDSINNWMWSFGDNSTANIQDPVHAYINTGLYPVTLISTTAHGCRDSSTQNILVKQSPGFIIQGNDVCSGVAATFSSSPLIPVVDSVGFVWNFGDNTFSSIINPVHNYFLPGTYTVTLTTTDLVNSCSADTSLLINIHQLPDAGFNLLPACINAPVNFIDTSVSGSAQISAWSWDFSNGLSSQLQSPVTSFNVAGNFPVRLKVTDSFGCTDSVIKQVQVNALPVISVLPSVSFGPPPLAVTFTNNSTPGTYLWNFNDGTNPDNTFSPLHLFADTGNYNVSVIATSVAGCIDSAHYTILVLTPYLDLAVEAISYTRINGYLVMKASLRNTGNLAITSCELFAHLDGKSQFNEQVNFSTALMPGSLTEYTFTTRFPSGGNEFPAFLCVRILSVNNDADQNSLNNELCAASSAAFEIVNINSSENSGAVLLSVNLPSAGNLGITIWDNAGRLITDNGLINAPKGLSVLALPATSLAKGTYLMQVIYMNEKITKRFLKQ